MMGFLPETLINDLDQTLNPETREIPQWGFLPETRIIDGIQIISNKGLNDSEVWLPD